MFLDGCKREMQAKVRNVGAGLKINGMGWAVVACLFTNDTVLFAESAEELQRMVDEFFV